MKKKTKNPWLVLSSKRVYENPFINVREDVVITPEGRKGIHHLIGYGRRAAGSVCVVAVDDNKDIFLVRQYRYAYRGYSLEVVAGMVTRGTTPLSAARNELAEEAGLAASSWVKLGETYGSTESSTQKSHLFLARQLKEARGSFVGENKMVVVRMPLAQAVASVLNGKIVHANSALAILLAERRLSRK